MKLLMHCLPLHTVHSRDVGVAVAGLEPTFSQPVLVAGGEGHRRLVPLRQPLPESDDASGLTGGDEGVVTQLHEAVGQGHRVEVPGLTVRPDDVLKKTHRHGTR